jgi:hypothetical protein
MKRNRILLVIFLLVLIPTIIVLMKNKSKTLTGKDTDFAVEDTASVTKIFIANKNGGKVLLERKSKSDWTVNGRYPARPDNIKLLLETFKRVQVRYPAPKSAQESLLKDFASRAVKCEIYCNDKLSRIWYISHETQDLKGTFCLLQDPNADHPFETIYVLEIPGFIGVITPRFYTKEEDWRDEKVLALLPTQIKNVSLDLVGFPDSSFTIDVKGLHDFSVRSHAGKEVAPFDTLAVQQYLSYFMSLYVDAWATNSTEHEIDSVKKSPYFLEINITDVNNQRQNFKFYHKPPVEGQEVLDGVRMVFDPDNVYMKFRDDKEFARVSSFSWGKLFQPVTYFYPKHPVKK